MLRHLLTVGCLLAGVLAATPAQAATAAAAPLPENLETIRRAEAVKLYGDDAVRPLDQRKSALISLGDSEMSGEGAVDRSLYEPGTDGPTNWCHRSTKSLIHVTSIPADVTYNVACSGGSTSEIVIGGTHQYEELNQGDNLAIKARNTRIKLVTVLIGANDSGGPEFGPTMTDCVTRRVLFQGSCWPQHVSTWGPRVDYIVPRVAKALTDIKQIMKDAGYADSDYQLVSMSYPGPASPDVEDNPNFPGWYGGGCLGYLADLAFARTTAVPRFEQGIRSATKLAGARYLDTSRLFHGREVCQDSTWVTGLHAVNGNFLDANSVRQSFHPNPRGHAAMGDCVSKFFAADLPEAACMVPAAGSAPQLYPGAPAFRQLKQAATGNCVDVDGNSSRNGRKLISWACEGTRNQSFWYDPATKALHTQLSHDRCADINAGRLTAGTEIQVWDCNAAAAQRWTYDGARLKADGAPTLCATFPGTSRALGDRMVLAACDPADSRQVFTWEQPTPITYTELKLNGKCLDIPGNAPSSGTNLLLYACDGSDDQFWGYNPVSGQLHNLGDTSFCVDVEGGAMAAGTPIQVADCASAIGAYSDSMRWNLTGGTFASRKNGSWVLGAAGTANNTPVTLQSSGSWENGASRKPDPWKFLTIDTYAAGAGA